jgi:transposase
MGVWRRIHDALRDRLRVRAGRDRCPTAAVIDSQTVPAADTVPRSPRGWDGGKPTNGVKRHNAVDVCGLLLAVVVTAASIRDRRRRASVAGRTARQLPAGLGPRCALWPPRRRRWQVGLARGGGDRRYCPEMGERGFAA